MIVPQRSRVKSQAGSSSDRVVKKGILCGVRAHTFVCTVSISVYVLLWKAKLITITHNYNNQQSLALTSPLELLCSQRSRFMHLQRVKQKLINFIN